jgi:APA family basic amino acid/polyamine antiporter
MNADVQARAGRLPGAVALVVGQVIAVGIFLTPGTMIRTVGSPFLILAIWAAMGGMAICGALCYGALAARYPHSGGGYVYLREAYGARVAFLYGWKCLLVMDPGITAALATGLASYVAYLAPIGPGATRLVAVVAIVTFALVHVAGVRIGLRLLGAVAALKITILLALILAAFASPVASWAHFTPFFARVPNGAPLGGALAGASIAAFFAFGGWWEVTKVAGELDDPRKTLPRALLIGLVIVTVAYAAATMAFLAVLPPGTVAEGQAIVAQVGEAILGSGGGAVLAGIVIVCVLGSLGTMQLVAPRLYVAMARDGLLPAGIAAIHPRLGTPVRAIVTQALLASVLVVLGTFDAIVAYFVFITVVFIAATAASVFVIRSQDPTFRVPGHPWTTLTFLGLVLALLVLLALGSPLQAALGVVVVSVALPVYQLIPSRSK